MDKISRLRKESIALEQEKKRLELMIERNNLLYRSNQKNIASAYQEFYIKKANQEFVLYDKYPNVEALKLYLREISSCFPLYDYGTLNVKELAEIIKHVYQFKTGKEFQILTIGATENYATPVYGSQTFSLRPHVLWWVTRNLCIHLRNIMECMLILINFIQIYIYMPMVKI